MLSENGETLFDVALGGSKALWYKSRSKVCCELFFTGIHDEQHHQLQQNNGEHSATATAAIKVEEDEDKNNYEENSNSNLNMQKFQIKRSKFNFKLCALLTTVCISSLFIGIILILLMSGWVKKKKKKLSFSL